MSDWRGESFLYSVMTKYRKRSVFHLCTRLVSAPKASACFELLLALGAVVFRGGTESKNSYIMSHFMMCLARCRAISFCVWLWARTFSLVRLERRKFPILCHVPTAWKFFLRLLFEKKRQKSCQSCATCITRMSFRDRSPFQNSVCRVSARQIIWCSTK